MSHLNFFLLAAVLCVAVVGDNSLRDLEIGYVVDIPIAPIPRVHEPAPPIPPLPRIDAPAIAVPVVHLRAHPVAQIVEDPDGDERRAVCGQQFFLISLGVGFICIICIASWHFS